MQQSLVSLGKYYQPKKTENFIKLAACSHHCPFRHEHCHGGIKHLLLTFMHIQSVVPHCVDLRYLDVRPFPQVLPLSRSAKVPLQNYQLSSKFWRSSLSRSREIFAGTLGVYHLSFIAQFAPASFGRFLTLWSFPSPWRVDFCVPSSGVKLSHTKSAAVKSIMLARTTTSLTQGLKTGWTSRSVAVVRKQVRLASVVVQLRLYLLMSGGFKDLPANRLRHRCSLAVFSLSIRYPCKPLQL